MISYEKTMTRDAPLCIVEAWYRAFAETIPAVFGFAWPLPVYLYRNGAVESWRPAQGFHGDLQKQVAAWFSESEAHRERFLEAVVAYEKINQRIRAEKEAPVDAANALERLLDVCESFAHGAAGLIPVYWCVTWDAEGMADFPKDIIHAGRRAREQDTLMDDCVELAYQYLDALARGQKWPAALTKFLSTAELAAAGTGEPDFAAVGRLRNGYVLMNGGTVPLGELSVRLTESGIELMQDPPSGEANELRGTAANPGRAVGFVRIVMNREELAKVGEGDILVSPMTTPLFLPAMKRAAAFVTDEGGVVCHAAIVAREMGKPCVVGTKIATQVLKDGDQVEVDAEKGVVRKIALT